MGYDLMRETSVFQNLDNHDWLGSAHGTDTADSITLDAAALLTAYPTGEVPAGIEISRNGSGVYVPGSTGTQRGFLLHAVKVNTVTPTNVVGALHWHGEVIVARVPVPAGGSAPVA